VRSSLAPRTPASQGSGSNSTLTGGGATWALQDLIHTYHRQRQRSRHPAAAKNSLWKPSLSPPNYPRILNFSVSRG